MKSLPQVKSAPQPPSGHRHQTATRLKVSTSRLSMVEQKPATAVKKRVDSFILRSTRDSSMSKLHKSHFAAKLSNRSCEPDRDDSKDKKPGFRTPMSTTTLKEVPGLDTLFSELKSKSISKFGMLSPTKSRAHLINTVGGERVAVKIKSFSPYLSKSKSSVRRDHKLKLIRE